MSYASGLKPSDNVVMVNCYEAEKYAGVLWEVESKPWKVCGIEVVKLKGKSGGFATSCLKKIEMEAKEL